MSSDTTVPPAATVAPTASPVTSNSDVVKPDATTVKKKMVPKKKKKVTPPEAGAAPTSEGSSAAPAESKKVVKSKPKPKKPLSKDEIKKGVSGPACRRLLNRAIEPVDNLVTSGETKTLRFSKSALAKLQNLALKEVHQFMNAVLTDVSKANRKQVHPIDIYNASLREMPIIPPCYDTPAETPVH
jgi:hypothetical protein